jgi:cytochrome c oxidase assembly factor CtaG
MSDRRTDLVAACVLIAAVAFGVVAAGAVTAADAAAPTLAYLLMMRRLRRTGAWPTSRAAWFIGAVVLAAAVTMPAVDDRTRTSLEWHMSQQMTLLLVVPAGLVAGRPLRLFRSATGHGTTWAPGPATAWIAFVGVQWLVHLPVVLDALDRTPALYGLMHLALVAAGVTFVAQIARPGRSIANPLVLGLYVVSAMPTTDAIALWLIFDPHVVYPAYAGPGALADQRNAGTIMFAAGNLLLVAAGVVVGRYLWEGRPSPPRATSEARS